MIQASDVAYRKVKSMIFRGSLGPGQRLVERTLARELGVSRIPVREGLARLESEGLVRSVPNSATFVEDFVPRDVLEIFSMRLLLEPLAARLNAARPSAKLVIHLRRQCSRMADHVAAGDWARLEEADYQFHRLIVRASAHRRLLRAYDGSHIHIIGLKAGRANMPASQASSAALEHERIVRCIERGDPDAAERAAHDHVKRAMTRIERVLSVRL